MKRFIVFFCILLLAPVFAKAASPVDTDGDGLPDDDETKIYATDPRKLDTDDDGYSDGEEIKNGFSPRLGDKKKMIEVDSDKDYLNDAWEVSLGTGVLNPDSDDDKYLDGTEVAAGYDPLNSERVRVPKLIEVDIATQHLRYSYDGVELGSFPISGGVKSMPTPKGSFMVLAKVPVKHYGGPAFDYPNTKWNLHFTTKKYRYYIHGAYWHNDFGKPKSHGCVNVSYVNMEPLYWFAQVGTEIVIR